MASLAAVTINLIISVTLHGRFGYKILALGIAASAIVNFSVLYVLFQRYVARISHRALLLYAARVILSSAVMGAFVYGTHYVLDVHVFGDRGGTTIDVIEVMTPVMVGVLSYAVAARVLGIPEVEQYMRRLRRRAN
jgi:peptidoglycan biosynthesis protein MviN/MurJ (putative lipid II flippase)